MKTVGRIFSFIFGILIIAGGISLLFAPVYTSLMLGYIVGLFMIFNFVALFIDWIQVKKAGSGDGMMLFCAILSLVMGILILNNLIVMGAIDIFFYYYLAFFFIAHGIAVIVRSIKAHKVKKTYSTEVIGSHWVLGIILGILEIILGIISCFNPALPASLLGILIAIAVIACGCGLINYATTPAAK